MNCDIKKLLFFSECVLLWQMSDQLSSPCYWKTQKYLRKLTDILYSIDDYCCLSCLAVWLFARKVLSLQKCQEKTNHFPDTFCFWLELYWCSHASLLPVPPGRLIRGEQSCSTIKTASCVSRHLVESLTWRILYLLPRTWPPIELTERHDIT